MKKRLIKNNTGITLISLVITIIVLLILAGVAILMLSGENGILKKSAKASFASDIGKYKEELELYKYNYEIEDRTGKNNPLDNIKGQTYWLYDEIKKYISSFDKKYEGKIGIVDGKLAFKGSGQEEKWAKELGLEIKSEKAKIKIQIVGNGEIKDLPENGIIETIIGEPIDLKVKPGSVQANGQTINYEFTGWYEEGEKVHAKEDYKFEVKGDRTLTAVFETDATIVYYLDENGEEKILADTSADLKTYKAAGITKTNITKVHIGKNCTSIYESAFNGCTNMVMDLRIREGISLGSQAFNGSGITSLEIGNGINVPIKSFRGCTKLEEVVVGNDVTLQALVSNDGSFGGCTSLNKVTMGENIKITSIGNTISNALFYQCTALEEVKISSLSQVGQHAFGNVKTALKGDIIINEDVTEIGASAFLGCTNITSVSIPSTVTKIGNMAFYECTGVTNSIILPESLTSIGMSAFYKCSGIKGNLEIKEGITLGSEAFNYCTEITSLKIGNGINVPIKSFRGCTKLEEVVVGNNVTLQVQVSNDGSFGGCTSLNTVTMGENIKITSIGLSISNALFYQCTALEEVRVGSLSGVGRNAFINVGKALKGDIKINEGVTNIGIDAFNGCTNIESVTIPSTVTTIGEGAFYNCTGIQTITINMTEEDFKTKVQAANNWKDNVNVNVKINYN